LVAATEPRVPHRQADLWPRFLNRKFARWQRKYVTNQRVTPRRWLNNFAVSERKVSKPGVQTLYHLGVRVHGWRRCRTAAERLPQTCTVLVHDGIGLWLTARRALRTSAASVTL